MGEKLLNLTPRFYLTLSSFTAPVPGFRKMCLILIIHLCDL